MFLESEDFYKVWLESEDLYKVFFGTEVSSSLTKKIFKSFYLGEKSFIWSSWSQRTLDGFQRVRTIYQVFFGRKSLLTVRGTLQDLLGSRRLLYDETEDLYKAFLGREDLYKVLLGPGDQGKVFLGPEYLYKIFLDHKTFTMSSWDQETLTMSS